MESRKKFKPVTLRDMIPYLRNVKQRNEETVAACPVCEAGESDGHHLYVRESGGKLLAYCQKCNAKLPEILRALDIRPELVEEEKPVKKEKPAKGEKPVKTGKPVKEEKPQNTESKPGQIKHAKPEVMEEYDHVYKNPDGTAAYCKHRVKYADGSKIFRFRHVDGRGKTVFKKPEGCNNLYNLDLLERADADTCLYIVEGEKCADAMVQHGFLATTANAGARKNVKLSPTDLRYLNKFSEIVLIPDNDEKGADYAKAWPVPVEVLDLTEIWPDCPAKGDVADYFARGGDPEKLSVSVDYSNVTKKEMIGMRFYESLYAIKNENRRQYAVSVAEQRARELNIARQFSKGWQTFLRSRAKVEPEAVAVNRTNFPDQPLALDAGDWTADGDGVKRMVQDRNGNMKEEYASRLPVLPLEILRNTEEGTEKIRLGFYKYGKWNSILVPRSSAASSVKIVELADMGLDVTSENARLLVKYLADVTSLNMDAIPVVKSCRHMGWAGETFLPYTDEIRLDSEAQYKDLIASVSSRGDLQAWIDFTAELRRNTVLRLLMGAAFASPLIAKVNALPFVFHLWGGTGTGKTAGIMAAASIWGDPRPGRLVRTVNMTVNSMMQMASVLRNLPFFGDELQTVKSRYENYDNLIMQVTEGINRGRMTNTALQQQMIWENAFVFTGEEPCTQNVSGGGVKNRVIEVECTDNVLENGNSVVNFINNNYGLAGQEYIRLLGKYPVRELFEKKMKNILDATGTSEKQAMAMALILTADRLAGWAFYPEEEALTAEDVKPFLKVQTDIDVAKRAYREIMGVILEHEVNFKPDMNAMRWGRMGSTFVEINKTVLVRELRNIGFHFDAVKKQWAEQGYLLKNAYGKYASRASIDGENAYYVCLKFDPAA